MNSGMLDLRELDCGPFPAGPPQGTFGPPTGVPIAEHAAILVGTDSAVEMCAQLRGTCAVGDEADLWALFGSLLEDSERAVRYHPDAIGLAATPPSRRWYTTHMAHIQDALLRRPKLRQLVVIMRWLEATHNARNRAGRTFYVVSDHENVGPLAAAVLDAVRGGNTADGIRIAEHAGNVPYCGLLDTALLRAHREPWHQHTAIVQLFGEYARTVEADWTTNDDRIDHIAELYAQSCDPAVDPREAALCAALSGNPAPLRAAFDTRRWQDALWIACRCSLVRIFSKMIMSIDGSITNASANEFRAHVAELCPHTDTWLSTAIDTTISEASAICAAATTQASQSSPAELVQLRLIQDILCGSTKLFAATASVPLSAATFIVADRAFSNGLLQQSPQQSAALSAVSREYCSLLVTAQRLDATEAFKLGIGVAMRLNDTNERASVVAGLIVALRSRQASTLEVAQREHLYLRAAKEIDAKKGFLCAGTSQGFSAALLQAFAAIESPTPLVPNTKGEVLLWRVMLWSGWDMQPIADDIETTLCGLWHDGDTATIQGILRVLTTLEDAAPAATLSALWTRYSEAEQCAEECARRAATSKHHERQHAAGLALNSATHADGSLDQLMAIVAAVSRCKGHLKLGKTSSVATAHAGVLLRCVALYADCAVLVLRLRATKTTPEAALRVSRGLLVGLEGAMALAKAAECSALLDAQRAVRVVAGSVSLQENVRSALERSQS